MGIRNILNLRGANKLSFYLFEKETCDGIGIQMKNLGFSARSLAERNVLLELLDIFEQIERPFVMHCKSGADRVGLASVLYLLHMTDTPIAQAKRQLSIRYIHIRSSQTGILDHMIENYEAHNKKEQMPTRTWIEECYDRAPLSAEFFAMRDKS
ncbi:MAG: hypothetical protein ACU0DI_15835 [Paracoccaceae bacterium]